jgi:hypothetical protein
MPDPITPPVASGTEPTPPPEPKFSQADIDRVVKERLDREKAKYADYEALKGKATKLDELEAANKTEAEKLAVRLATIEQALGLKDKEIERLASELTGTKRANLAGSVANRLGAYDPQDANIIAAISAIDPAGANAETEIETALKDLQTKKPYLFKAAGAGNPKGGVEPFNPSSGGGAAETDAQRLQRLLRAAGQNSFGPLGG